MQGSNLESVGRLHVNVLIFFHAFFSSLSFYVCSQEEDGGSVVSITPEEKEQLRAEMLQMFDEPVNTVRTIHSFFHVFFPNIPVCNIETCKL